MKLCRTTTKERGDYMALPNYNNSWNYGYGNQQLMNSQSNMNNSQNPLMYGNQLPQQNFGSFMTVLVQGEAGANAYPVASGNTVMLLDFESNKFWLKSNVNGIPQRLRTFSFIEEIQEQQQPVSQNNGSISREEFETLSRNVTNLSESMKKLVADLGGTSNE